VLYYKKHLKKYSRQLRKNMTEAEKQLWSKVRNKQLEKCQFYRQKPIGDFIVDFYCPKSGLVIELDGGQHYDKNMEERDKSRDGYMKKLGFTVLRFSDREVFENMEGVLEKILNEISPNPSFSKRGNSFQRNEISPNPSFTKRGNSFQRNEISPNPSFSKRG